MYIYIYIGLRKKCKENRKRKWIESWERGKWDNREKKQEKETKKNNKEGVKSEKWLSYDGMAKWVVGGGKKKKETVAGVINDASGCYRILKI